MRKIIGLICLVLGGILIFQGRSIPEDLDHQLKNFLPGMPVYRTTYLYIAGGLLIAYGLLNLVWPRKKS